MTPLDLHNQAMELCHKSDVAARLGDLRESLRCLRLAYDAEMKACMALAESGHKSRAIMTQSAANIAERIYDTDARLAAEVAI